LSLTSRHLILESSPPTPGWTPGLSSLRHLICPFVGALVAGNQQSKANAFSSSVNPEVHAASERYAYLLYPMQLAKTPRPRRAQVIGWAAAPPHGNPSATPYARFGFSFLNLEQFASFYMQPFFLTLAVPPRYLPSVLYNSFFLNAYATQMYRACSSPSSQLGPFFGHIRSSRSPGMASIIVENYYS
jgi:hypothetical protein